MRKYLNLASVIAIDAIINDQNVAGNDVSSKEQNIKAPDATANSFKNVASCYFCHHCNSGGIANFVCECVTERKV